MGALPSGNHPFGGRQNGVWSIRSKPSIHVRGIIYIQDVGLTARELGRRLAYRSLHPDPRHGGPYEPH